MKPKYSLISKPPAIKWTQYKGDIIRLGECAPYTVEEVVIGINGSKTQTKKIITLRDSGGNITERIFDYPDRPLWNRLYSSTENDIGIEETVVSTTKSDYKLNRSLVETYKELVQEPYKSRTILWDHKGTTVDHVSYNLDKDEIILTQVKVKNKPDSRLQRHSFTEYPRIKMGKCINTKPKELSFNVRSKDNSVVTGSIHTSDEKLIPQDDDFLGFRALTIEDAKKPFVNRFLIERGMDDKGIRVEPRYTPRKYADSEFNAIFDSEDGAVKFNKDAEILSKSRLAKTSAHEAEHSWHYFLQALLNGGGTPWQTEMAQKFGKIKDKKTLKEAKNYDRSIKTYVHYYENLARYRRNYIEIKAHRKGREAQEKYDFDGQDIRRSFKHIPSIFL